MDVKKCTFYREHVIQNFVQTSREVHDGMTREEPLSETAFPARLYFDGNMSQLKVSTSPATIDQNRKEKLCCIKHNPARTGTEQACDLSKNFPESNKKQKELLIKADKSTPLYHRIKKAMEKSKKLHGINLGAKEETVVLAASSMSEVEDTKALRK